MGGEEGTWSFGAVGRILPVHGWRGWSVRDKQRVRKARRLTLECACGGPAQGPPSPTPRRFSPIHHHGASLLPRPPPPNVLCADLRGSRAQAPAPRHAPYTCPSKSGIRIRRPVDGRAWATNAPFASSPWPATNGEQRRRGRGGFPPPTHNNPTNKARLMTTFA